MKTQPMKWEKISTNHISHKGLISKIFKELIQLITKKANNQIKKWTVDIFPKKIKMNGQQLHTKTCSTTENVNQTTIRYHLKLIRMAFLKKIIYYKYCWEYGGKKGTMVHYWWEWNWYSQFGKLYRTSSKKKEELPNDLAGHISKWSIPNDQCWSYIQRKWNQYLKEIFVLPYS